MSARSAHELYEDDFYAWTKPEAKERRRFARTPTLDQLLGDFWPNRTIAGNPG